MKMKLAQLDDRTLPSAPIFNHNVNDTLPERLPEIAAGLTPDNAWRPNVINNVIDSMVNNMIDTMLVRPAQHLDISQAFNNAFVSQTATFQTATFQKAAFQPDASQPANTADASSATDAATDAEQDIAFEKDQPEAKNTARSRRSVTPGTKRFGEYRNARFYKVEQDGECQIFTILEAYCFRRYPSGRVQMLKDHVFEPGKPASIGLSNRNHFVPMFFSVSDVQAAIGCYVKEVLPWIDQKDMPEEEFEAFTKKRLAIQLKIFGWHGPDTIAKLVNGYMAKHVYDPAVLAAVYKIDRRDIIRLDEYNWAAQEWNGIKNSPDTNPANRSTHHRTSLSSLVAQDPRALRFMLPLFHMDSLLMMNRSDTYESDKTQRAENIKCANAHIADINNGVVRYVGRSTDECITLAIIQERMGSERVARYNELTRTLTSAIANIDELLDIFGFSNTSIEFIKKASQPQQKILWSFITASSIEDLLKPIQNLDGSTKNATSTKNQKHPIVSVSDAVNRITSGELAFEFQKRLDDIDFIATHFAPSTIPTSYMNGLMLFAQQRETITPVHITQIKQTMRDAKRNGRVKKTKYSFTSYARNFTSNHTAPKYKLPTSINAPKS